jgi:hypothetical protein
VILPSLYRSRPPRCRPVSHSDIKISFPPEEGLETRKVVRSDDWQGKDIEYLSEHDPTKVVRTSDPERIRAWLHFGDLSAAAVSHVGDLRT